VRGAGREGVDLGETKYGGRPTVQQEQLSQLWVAEAPHVEHEHSPILMVWSRTLVSIWYIEVGLMSWICGFRR
jgi:hypothetical protein